MFIVQCAFWARHNNLNAFNKIIILILIETPDGGEWHKSQIKYTMLIKRYKCCSGPNRMIWYEHMKHKPSYHVYRDQLNTSSCLYNAWSLCYQVGQAKWKVETSWFGDMTVKASDRCDRTSTVTIFYISHLLFVLQYFYHNFESCCWTIYTNFN